MVFDSFSNLVMWRVHFLAADTLMLKFGTLENVNKTALHHPPITEQGYLYDL